MNQAQSRRLRHFSFFAASMLATSLLIGCSGDDGAQGPPGPPGPPGMPLASDATELTMTIDSVSVNSAPVVNFTAKNQDGIGVVGLTTSNVRFTIAKLLPATTTDSSRWQSYLTTVQNASAPGAPKPIPSARQATYENTGTLVDHGDGTYTYTFKTDIANLSCPAPCTDAAGNPLDLSYQPNLSHRVAIQTSGVPLANPVFDFVPAGGALPLQREIVQTSNCNECHDRLVAHGGRIETKFCVMCHNPGSTDPDSGNTVDFKVMVHKIHRGANLPTVGGCNRPGCVVAGGGTYAIWGYRNTKHDFSTIELPQDIRNCTKCHDGADAGTPQGDNWNTSPSIQACGSCHEHTKFNEAPGTTANSHPGGVVTDNTACTTCHAETRVAGSPAESHTILEKVAGTKLKFNILAVCGTAPGSNPQCGNPATPVVTFSVTDPTGAATHGYGNAYNIKTDPEFTQGSTSTLNLLTAWNTSDYSNNLGSGSRPARANSFNLISTPLGANFLDNGDGTYTVNLGALPATATTSGTVALEGHPAGVGESGTFADAVRAQVKSVTAAFGISDNPVKPRRVVVEVTSKCDRCHDLLSVHGNNRSDEAQLCVMCHNPRNTDVGQRPKTAGVPDDTLTADSKREESIDFKRLIHGIHAAAKANFDGTIEHGFRNKPLVIYGFGGSVHNFGEVRFPGELNRCTTCHLEGTYQLAGLWEQPTLNGVLGSTVESVPNAIDAGSYTTGINDQSDDLVISPTAAVCSACHDSDLARQHMINSGGAQFGVLQTAVNSGVETCAICHGPGRIASVDFVHSGVFGEDIP